jgi:hypothetical protein
MVLHMWVCSEDGFPRFPKMQDAISRQMSVSSQWSCYVLGCSC